MTSSMKPYELSSLVAEKLLGHIWTREVFPARGASYGERVWYWLHEPGEPPHKTPSSYLEPTTREAALEAGLEHWGRITNYANDTAAAMHLIMGRHFWWPYLERKDLDLAKGNDFTIGSWYVRLSTPGKVGFSDADAYATTPAEAICLAALRTIGVEV